MKLKHSRLTSYLIVKLQPVDFVLRHCFGVFFLQNVNPELAHLAFQRMVFMVLHVNTCNYVCMKNLLVVQRTSKVSDD